MINVLVSGALGHMGSILCKIVEEAPDMNLAARVDVFSTVPEVFTRFEDVTEDVDMVIDFSHHSLIGSVLDFAQDQSCAAVIATTGFTQEERELISDASRRIPVFISANMSMGVALLCKMARAAAAAFPEADIEIVEAHHNRKIDAPSGTALLIAESIREVRPESRLVAGRKGMQKREKEDIGIASLRMGNLAGMHEVIVTTATQSITLKHEVYDRALFAEGAAAAARFLATQAPGLYDMKSMIG